MLKRLTNPPPATKIARSANHQERAEMDALAQAAGPKGARVADALAHRAITVLNQYPGLTPNQRSAIAELVATKLQEYGDNQPDED